MARDVLIRAGEDWISLRDTLASPPETPALATIEGINTSALEGVAGFKYRARIRLSKPLSVPQSIEWKTRGVGLFPADAADFGGGFPGNKVFFAAGATVVEIELGALNDTAVEPDETFEIYLENPSELIQIGASARLTCTILNDDIAPAPPVPDPVPPPPPSPTTGTLRTVLSDGTTMTESQPKKGAWTTQFRKFGTRIEVVLNLGLCHSGAAANSNITEWAIYDGDKLLARRPVPKFNWRGRDRWQSESEPFVRTVAQAVEEGLLPKYSTAGLNRVNRPSIATYSPMGFGALRARMFDAGGRPDIGIHTGWTAQYLENPTAANAASIRAVAETAGSMPCMVFDENTGKPLSFVDYPSATNTDPRFEGTPKIQFTDTGWGMDMAHFPDVSYPMAVLTGGLYHIENLQMQVISFLINSAPIYRQHGKCIVIPIQVRYWAWFMRMIARCARVTPEEGGPTLLPKKVFLDILKNNRVEMERQTLRSASRQQTVFHDIMDMKNQPTESGLQNQYVKVWQGYYLSQACEDILRMGFKEWEPLTDFFLDAALKRTSLGTGWNRAYPANYQDMIAATPGNVVGSYAEAWDLTRAKWGRNHTADTLSPDQDWNYVAQLRAVLAMAGKRNAQSSACFDWLHPQLSNSPWGVDIQTAIAT